MARTVQTAQIANLATMDPIWAEVRREAEHVVRSEPALAGFVYATILSKDRLEDAVCHRLAQRLNHSDVDAGLIAETFGQVLAEHPELGRAFRADLAAVYDRDPACSRYIEPLLYFKGFHALVTHRFAHELLKQGRRDFALYLQSQSSRIFAVDINPAARIGIGIMLDHGTGIVIGETAVVGDNCSILQNVTLGGTGKETGDRHPKIGANVLLSVGAKVLGNIKVGDCSIVGAGSVVLKEVPPRTTVAGVPAKEIGPARCPDPARTMDQRLAPDDCGCS
jgi:serine O-acetyltransferase